MKMISTRTNGEWVKIDPLTTAAGKDSDPEARGYLKMALLDALRAEYLLALCGLGTSLCVKGKDPKDASKDIRLAPTMQDLWKAATEKAGVSFKAILKAVNLDEEAAHGDIEFLLSRCQLARELHGTKEINDFIEATEQIIVKACRFIRQDTNLSTHEMFLRRVARRPTRQPRTRIFTTNYDQCFEAAAARSGFIAVDGFSHTSPQSFDSTYFDYDLVRRVKRDGPPEFIPNVFQLYKLHGSVDWTREGGMVRRDELAKRPLLIYPRHTKFESSYEPPFIDFMGRFQISLRLENAAMLVIGFGFKDNHLTQPILSAIRANVGLRLVVVDPDLEKPKSEAIEEITRLIKSGDSRLTLLQASYEEFVPAIPDLVAETEDERHEQRLRGKSDE
jgi:hypothetical protein